MPWDVILGCLLIFVARLGDVSMDTLRMVAVIRGRRGWAWVFAFVQVLIWVYAISVVMKNITDPAYAISYALGFATGNFLGIVIENWVAHGEQGIRIFTRDGDATAERLRAHGYGVTIFDGRGKDGPVSLVYLESTRRRIREVVKIARQMDPSCFYVIDDVRTSSTSTLSRIVSKETPVQTASVLAEARNHPGANVGAASGGAAT